MEINVANVACLKLILALIKTIFLRQCLKNNDILNN